MVWFLGLASREVRGGLDVFLRAAGEILLALSIEEQGFLCCVNVLHISQERAVDVAVARTGTAGRMYGCGEPYDSGSGGRSPAFRLDSHPRLVPELPLMPAISASIYVVEIGD